MKIDIHIVTNSGSMLPDTSVGKSPEGEYSPPVLAFSQILATSIHGENVPKTAITNPVQYTDSLVADQTHLHRDSEPVADKPITIKSTEPLVQESFLIDEPVQRRNEPTFLNNTQQEPLSIIPETFDISPQKTKTVSRANQKAKDEQTTHFARSIETNLSVEKKVEHNVALNNVTPQENLVDQVNGEKKSLEKNPLFIDMDESLDIESMIKEFSSKLNNQTKSKVQVHRLPAHNDDIQVRVDISAASQQEIPQIIDMVIHNLWIPMQQKNDIHLHTEVPISKISTDSSGIKFSQIIGEETTRQTETDILSKKNNTTFVHTSASATENRVYSNELSVSVLTNDDKSLHSANAEKIEKNVKEIGVDSKNINKITIDKPINTSEVVHQRETQKSDMSNIVSEKLTGNASVSSSNNEDIGVPNKDRSDRKQDLSKTAFKNETVITDKAENIKRNPDVRVKTNDNSYQMNDIEYLPTTNVENKQNTSAKRVDVSASSKPTDELSSLQIHRAHDDEQEKALQQYIETLFPEKKSARTSLSINSPTININNITGDSGEYNQELPIPGDFEETVVTERKTTEVPTISSPVRIEHGDVTKQSKRFEKNDLSFFRDNKTFVQSQEDEPNIVPEKNNSSVGITNKYVERITTKQHIQTKANVHEGLTISEQEKPLILPETDAETMQDSPKERVENIINQNFVTVSKGNKQQSDLYPEEQKISSQREKVGDYDDSKEVSWVNSLTDGAKQHEDIDLSQTKQSANNNTKIGDFEFITANVQSKKNETVKENSSVKSFEKNAAYSDISTKDEIHRDSEINNATEKSEKVNAYFDTKVNRNNKKIDVEQSLNVEKLHTEVPSLKGTEILLEDDLSNYQTQSEKRINREKELGSYTQLAEKVSNDEDKIDIIEQYKTSENNDENISDVKKNRSARNFTSPNLHEKLTVNKGREIKDIYPVENNGMNEESEGYLLSKLDESKYTHESKVHDSAKGTTVNNGETINQTKTDENSIDIIPNEKPYPKKDKFNDTVTIGFKRSNQNVIQNNNISPVPHDYTTIVPKQEMNSGTVSTIDDSKVNDHSHTIETFAQIESTLQENFEHTSSQNQNGTHTVTQNNASDANEKKLSINGPAFIAKDDDKIGEVDNQVTIDSIDGNSNKNSKNHVENFVAQSNDNKSRKATLSGQENTAIKTIIPEMKSDKNSLITEENLNSGIITAGKNAYQDRELQTQLPRFELKASKNINGLESDNLTKVSEDSHERYQREIPARKSLQNVEQVDDRADEIFVPYSSEGELQSPKINADKNVLPHSGQRKIHDSVSHLKDSINSTSADTAQETPHNSEQRKTKDDNSTVHIVSDQIDNESINKSKDFDENILDLDNDVYRTPSNNEAGKISNVENLDSQYKRNQSRSIIQSDSVDESNRGSNLENNENNSIQQRIVDKRGDTQTTFFTKENIGGNVTEEVGNTVLTETVDSKKDVHSDTDVIQSSDKITDKINSEGIEDSQFDEIVGNVGNKKISTNVQDHIPQNKIPIRVLPHESLNESEINSSIPEPNYQLNEEIGKTGQQISTENDNATVKKKLQSLQNSDSRLEIDGLTDNQKHEVSRKPSINDNGTQSKRIATKEFSDSSSKTIQSRDTELSNQHTHNVYNINDVRIDENKSDAKHLIHKEIDNNLSVRSKASDVHEKNTQISYAPINHNNNTNLESLDTDITDNSDKVIDESENQKENETINDVDSISRVQENTFVTHRPLQTNDASIYVLKNQSMDNAAIVVTSPQEQTMRDNSVPTTIHALHSIIEKASSVGMPVKNIVFTLRNNDAASSEKNIVKKDVVSLKQDSSIQFESNKETAGLSLNVRDNKIGTLLTPEKVLQNNASILQISSQKEKESLPNNSLSTVDFQSKSADSFPRISPENSGQNNSTSQDSGSYKRESLSKRQTLKDNQMIRGFDFEKNTREQSVSFPERHPLQKNERNIQVPDNDKFSTATTNFIDNKYAVLEEQSFVTQQTVQPLISHESINGVRGNEIVETSHINTGIMQAAIGQHVTNKLSAPTVKKSFEDTIVSTVPVHQFSEKTHEYISARTPSDGAVRMVLQPEELGTVIVRYATQNTDTQLQIQVDSQQTKQIIESQLPQLKEQFTKQGMQLDRVEVSVRKKEEDLSNSSQYSSNNRQGQSQQEQESRQQFTRSFKFAADARKAQTTLNYTSSAFNRIFQTQR